MVAANREQSLPGRSPRGLRGRRLPAGIGAQTAVAAAVPLAIALALLAVEDAFELGSWMFVTVLVAGSVFGVALLLNGLRNLHAAESRTLAALDRAETAEAAQRARADELARVLQASESLALTGEGQVDYLAVLAAITPADATSFLVRVEGETEAFVVAAHGPVAASVVGVRRPLPPRDSDGDATALISSFSASGHAIGLEMPREHMAAVESEIEAALTVRLLDHGGRSLGWLHVLDHRGERILQPEFVNVAQLVANQIAVAMENTALLARVRHQLGEVQRVQEQLVRASKLGAVGELAAAVAHEVNNPLTGILGFAELLMSELPEDDSRHDEAAIIRTEAVKARTIVKALLEFARPRPPQRIPANVNDLARSTLELVRFRASESDVRIVVDYADVPSLEIDPDASRQVLLNLFNNAIDAMPNGGELRVTTIAEDDRVGVVVADSGVGMSEETRSRIFTPFFSTRAGGGGAGLGLSVSMQIVQGHGGSIEVDSALDRGAAFTVWLPKSAPDFAGAVLIPGMASQSTGQDQGTAADQAQPPVSPTHRPHRSYAA
jgi:signal transduction histidine kinase